MGRLLACRYYTKEFVVVIHLHASLTFVDEAGSLPLGRSTLLDSIIYMGWLLALPGNIRQDNLSLSFTFFHASLIFADKTIANT